MAMRVLLVVYDNDDYIGYFPQGAAYIASSLRKAGHEVVIWSQDIHHWPDEALTDYLDAERFDVIGIGVIAGYYQYRRLKRLSQAVNRSKQRPTHYILGGFGPSPDPAFFLKISDADFVVLGEGEAVTVNLLQALEDKTPLADVQGIAWRDGSEIKVNCRAPLITDVDSIPWPAYDLFPINHYRLRRRPGCSNGDFSMSVLSGRGCTFKCTFCYRMDTGFRARNHDAVLDEVEYLQKDFGITYIDFSDELLMSSAPRTIEFCEAILRRGLKFKWACNGRLNYAKHDVLDVMKRSGCTFINYGIESVDNEVLKLMRKGLRFDQIISGIEKTREMGIHPGLNIIFGNLGDNKETLDQSVEFLLKYDDQGQVRTIRPVTPYPGSPLFDMAVEKGLIKDSEDFYDNKHTNSDLMTVNFTSLTDDEFYDSLRDANMRLLTNYYDKQKERRLHVTKHLYDARDASFRGFRGM